MDSVEDRLAAGLPHSEIPGSTIARISPGLFAACHVLHRLSVPRHPPDALTSRLIHFSHHPHTAAKARVRNTVISDQITAPHPEYRPRPISGQPLVKTLPFEKNT